MAKVKFYLKEVYKNGLSTIFLRIEHNKDKCKYYTRLSLPPQYWDKATQRAKTKGIKIKEFDYIEFNKALQDLEAETQRFILKFGNDNKRFPTKAELKAELDQLSGKNQIKPITLFSFIETIILERKDDVKAIKLFKTVFNYLKEFCKYGKIKELDFNDINHTFLNDFKSFAYEIKELSPNTLNKYVKKIKTIVKEGLKRKLHVSMDYQFLSIKNVPTHEIYLNESELEKIYKLDLSDRKGHEAVRDLFIIGCFTGGQRFSDWAKLKAENIVYKEGEPFFRYVSEKTETEAVVPLKHPYAQEILKKYNNVLPISNVNQVVNRHLKDIGELAGIDTIIKKITYPKNTKTEIDVPKYSLISSHTARRSFATNAYLSGISLNKIRLITGHSSEKQLLIYLKVSSFENAIEVSKSDFYNDTKTE